MLSTAASNTLLKTLEEPPSHVVFVLATTDPQKVLPTIRSRTQVFEFRLFAIDALTGLLRDVASQAGLELDDATLAAVAKRGNGSARDALSALDSVAASGGISDAFDITELAAAVGSRDVAEILRSIERASERGRDPRQLARDLIEVLRDVFLTHMGVPRPGASDELLRAFTPAASTRALEVLGETLVAQRDAIEPRIVLETALVRLANPDLDTSLAALVERLDRLERLVRSGADGASIGSGAPRSAATGPIAGAVSSAVPPAAPPAAVPPVAAPRAGVEVPAAVPPVAAPPIAVEMPAVAPPAAAHPTGVAVPPASAAGSAQAGSPTAGAAGIDPSPEQPASEPTLVPPTSARSAMPSLAPLRATVTETAESRRSGVADGARAQLGSRPASARPPARPTSSPRPTPRVAAPEPEPGPVDERDRVLEGLRGKARAMFSAGRFSSASPTDVEVALPNAMHLARCEEFVSDLAASFRVVRGHAVEVRLIVDPTAGAPIPDAPDDAGGVLANRRFATASGPVATPVEVATPASEEHEVDLDGLVDAGDATSSTLEHISRTFPGAELVREA